ncbi:MAG: ABC transporter substrate-binding protein [Rhodospirillales bacterium]|nr:ABC transporter substrate-binding protein [Rhodospirillales bacterium]
MFSCPILNRLVFVLGLGAAAFGPMPAVSDDSPRAIVAHFQDSLIAVMKDAKALGVRGRYERLNPIVERAFHIPLMTQIATAGSWTDASSEKRREMVNAFRRMNISTLATLFDGYNGETFEIVSEHDGPQNTRIVETRLIKTDKSTNDIAYVARQFSARWYLIDVVVDRGISEISVRRSEYARILKDQGIDGLIAVLNGKADELLSAKTASPR